MSHALAFYRASDGPALRALEDLVAACHPDRTKRDARWWLAVPTLVLHYSEPAGPGLQSITRLLGYAQFSIAPNTLFLYDCGVHPDFQRMRVGRMLLAERLNIGARFGCSMATGVVMPANTPMRKLLASAGFLEGEWIREHYQDVTPPVDGIPVAGGPDVFEWAKQEPEWVPPQ